MQIYEVKDYLPRAYFTPHWQWIDDQNDVKVAVENKDSQFDPKLDTFVNRKSTSGHPSDQVRDPFAPKLSAPPAVAPTTATAEGNLSSLASVSILQDQPEHVSVSIRTDRPGFVVLTDRFYPGWQALVDSVPQLIYEANVEARAVYVPAGSHLIEFDYQPDSLKTGFLLTSLGLIFGGLLLASAVAPFLRRSILAMAGQKE
jgi:hypothetical protein